MEKTQDYDQFKLLNYNRPINGRHVQALKEKIQLSNELSSHPIHVTKDMEVINGQHRLSAAKELRVPIYYEIIQNFNPEVLLHSNYAKQWTLEDYINYYSELGGENHREIENFSYQYAVPISTCFTLLTGSKNISVVKSAKVDPHRKECLIKTLGIVQALIENAHIYESKNRFVIESAKFLQALFVIIYRGAADISRLEKQLLKFYYKITSRARRIDYFETISEIYNYGLSNKIEIV